MGYSWPLSSTHGVKTFDDIFGLNSTWDQSQVQAGDTVICSTNWRMFVCRSAGGTWVGNAITNVQNSSGGAVAPGDYCCIYTGGTVPAITDIPAGAVEHSLGIVLYSAADTAFTYVATSGVWPIKSTGAVSVGSNFIGSTVTSFKIIQAPTQGMNGCGGQILETSFPIYVNPFIAVQGSLCLLWGTAIV